MSKVTLVFSEEKANKTAAAPTDAACSRCGGTKPTCCRCPDPVVTEISNDVEWINRLGVRFPTHRGVQKFRNLLQRIAEAHTYDPGETDLDDEQPVTMTGLTLGDVRLVRRLIR